MPQNPENRDTTVRRKIEIAVILAVRNEEKYIEGCLQSLLNQRYSQEKYEIIVIDGVSTDRTKDIITSYANKYPRLFRIYDNPKRTAPYGRNIGINNTEAEWVLIFGGHCKAHENLLSNLAEAMEKADTSIAGIGSIHLSPQDETFFGQVMHEVQSSVLGGFGTSFKQPTNMRFISSSAFTLYRKKVLLELGLHDVRFTTGQDMDLNWRIRKAGYKLVICRDAVVYYYRRHANMHSMINRMFEYGKWKAIFFRTHKGSFVPIYVVPSLITAGFLALPFSLLASPLLFEINLILVILYLCVISTGSAMLCFRKSSHRYLVSLPALLMEHLSFGLGFFVGVFWRINSLPASLTRDTQRIEAK